MQTDEPKGTYIAEMRKRNPPQTIQDLLASMDLTDPIKEEDLKAISDRQQEYAAIDGIPEHLWKYAKAYSAVTGQTPNGATRGDWIGEMEIWYQEKFREQDIQDAYEYVANKSGFPVGRPGTLTNIARGMKTKNADRGKTTGAVEATQKFLAEQDAHQPMSREELRARITEDRVRIKAKLAKPLYKKGMDPE